MNQQEFSLWCTRQHHPFRVLDWSDSLWRPFDLTIAYSQRSNGPKKQQRSRALEPFFEILLEFTFARPVFDFHAYLGELWLDAIGNDPNWFGESLALKGDRKSRSEESNLVT